MVFNPKSSILYTGQTPTPGVIQPFFYEHVERTLACTLSLSLCCLDRLITIRKLQAAMGLDYRAVLREEKPRYPGLAYSFDGAIEFLSIPRKDLVTCKKTLLELSGPALFSWQLCKAYFDSQGGGFLPYDPLQDGQLEQWSKSLGEANYSGTVSQWKLESWRLGLQMDSVNPTYSVRATRELFQKVPLSDQYLSAALEHLVMLHCYLKSGGLYFGNRATVTNIGPPGFSASSPITRSMIAVARALKDVLPVLVFSWLFLRALREKTGAAQSSITPLTLSSASEWDGVHSGNTRLELRAKIRALELAYETLHPALTTMWELAK